MQAHGTGGSSDHQLALVIALEKALRNFVVRQFLVNFTELIKCTVGSRVALVLVLRMGLSSSTPVIPSVATQAGVDLS
jgi:hypothetical protein